jgi:HAMP domain-containing protein
VPPDHQTKAWRTEANLQAMRLVLAKEPGELTTEDLQIIAQYSGWGGLSIDRVRKLLPPDFVPETTDLIHAYFTPTVITESIAELLCPLLPELAGNDGVVRALEPSAGTGRLIRSFSPRRCLALEAGGQIKRIAWTAVEFSKVSSTLLRALRPDVDLYNMPFERWVREEGRRFQGAISLIVANPPYGERGEMAREDPDEFYKEKRAYAYFMRRALDLLVPGGIGVFLVPAGFMSSTMNRGLREKLLRRHHLLGAFRLPSHDAKGREMVPGASVVMDLLVWRSRGGELSEVDAADQFIADGDYFKEFPGHILGQEDAPFGGDDEAGTARSWRYKVTGEFKGLPPLTPRPVCTACVLGSIAAREPVAFQTVVREDDSSTADVDADLRPALELGRRVGRYLAALGADEADRAAQLWPELHAALVDFAANFGNPWRSKPLRELAEVRQRTAAQQLLSAFDKDRRTRQGAARGADREAEVHGPARRHPRPGRGPVPPAARAVHRAAHGLPQAAGRHAHPGRGPGDPARRRVEPRRRRVGPTAPARRLPHRLQPVGAPRPRRGARQSGRRAGPRAGPPPARGHQARRVRRPHGPEPAARLCPPRSGRRMDLRHAQ